MTDDENIQENEAAAVPEEEQPAPDNVINIDYAADDTIRLAQMHRRKRIVRKGRAKQERLNGLLRLMLTISIIAGIYYSAKVPQWYLKPNAFDYAGGSTIQIINNKIVNSSKIYTILRHNQPPDKPVYMFKTADLKRQIRELPPVDNVYIRRYGFPARIQIIVREKVPVITISPDLKVPPVAFLTQDGKIIGQDYMPLSKDYKTIKVLSYESKWDEDKVAEIQKIVKYIETYAQEPVEYIDMRIPKNVFVRISTVNIRLGQLDGNVFKRIERIPAVLPQVKLVESKVKYLDLSWEKVNYLKLE